MTTAEGQASDPSVIFADARKMYDDSLRLLDQGDIRDAAEKAWCATKWATDALILSRTGEEPRTSGQTMRQIRVLRNTDPSLETLRLLYTSRQSLLHGRCFYDGRCDPVEDVIRDIRQTLDYIQDAERLVGGAGSS